MDGHDHSKCHLGPDGIASLPAAACDWPGHASAADEAGFCPVCQH